MMGASCSAGLDSNAALVVMQCMKRLAKQGDGRIVIASIHQPRAAIWELFNKVQVLSEGHSLYFGPRQQVRPVPDTNCPLFTRAGLPNIPIPPYVSMTE